MKNTRKGASSPGRRVGHLASTVSVTGFSVAQTGKSVAQTGKSVAQTVAPVSVFRPAQSLFASVCAAEFVNIYDHEIHVFRQVCNNCCTTTTCTTKKVVLVV